MRKLQGRANIDARFRESHVIVPCPGGQSHTNVHSTHAGKLETERSWIPGFRELLFTRPCTAGCWMDIGIQSATSSVAMSAY